MKKILSVLLATALLIAVSMIPGKEKQRKLSEKN